MTFIQYSQPHKNKQQIKTLVSNFLQGDSNCIQLSLKYIKKYTTAAAPE